MSRPLMKRMEATVLSTVVCLTLGSGAARSAAQEPSQAGAGEPRMRPGAQEVDNRDRGDVLAELSAAKAAFESEGTDDSRYAYANLLMEAGSFESAREVVRTLIEAGEPSLDALRLAARLAYFVGDYAASEALFSELLDRDPGNPRALTGLVFTYYQTNQFEAALELSKSLEGTLRLPVLDVMAMFEGEEPYKVEWVESPKSSDGPSSGGSRAAEVPFVSTDPLPVVEVEVDGRSVYAIIDTGADTFILDTDIAAELGIQAATSMTAMFAGGLEGKIGFAKASQLELGDVTLHSVPISIMPTKRLSLGGVEIGGIVGTSVLRQFLSTLDYPGGRLILRERSRASVESFMAGSAGRLADDIPFYLQGSHFILAHGSLNDHGGLLFHVDSGLAGVPSFAAPERTLEYVGIPVPEVSVRGDVIGGGGGGFAVGEFDIKSLGLGRIVRHDLVGSFGGQPPGSYWNLGFIQDGLISHNFLKEFSWTLDFDAMKMYLVGGA